MSKVFLEMTSYATFVKIDSEEKACVICASLERMSTLPVGVGILEVEDMRGLWEVSGFFLEKPNMVEIKILEVVHGVRFLVSKIIDKDWVAQVQRGLSPVRAGRFILYGYHDRKHVPVNLWGLRIDAAMAFGTGHHASTVGCLLSFEHLIKRGYFFKNVLDIGCGTGVLAMAVARAYPCDILATDIDEVAVETARTNLRVNRLKGKVRVAKSSGFKSLAVVKKSPYDLIFANILAKPLCSMANNMAKYSGFNGVIILSGILRRQANRVERYYFLNGFSRKKIITIDQWVTIIMQRK